MYTCPRCAGGQVSEDLDEGGEPQVCHLCHDRKVVRGVTRLQYRVLFLRMLDDDELAKQARYLYARYEAARNYAPAPF